MMAGRLGVAVLAINNANAIRTVWINLIKV